MNPQKAPGGIEWTRVRRPDGSVRPGYTWNPIVGCMHECKWQMPDGSIAECYAKKIAEGLAKDAYPDGFYTVEDHPERYADPFSIKEPAGIFIGSQTDIMQRGMRDSEIETILKVVAGNPQHIFFLLTKNAPRLWQYADDFPDNLWVGVSMPPTWMYGKRLSEHQQQKFVIRALKILDRLSVKVRWMSFEPLSFPVHYALREYFQGYGHLPLEWAVIGAASNGAKKYQPDPRHLQDLVFLLKKHDIPIFFKGNLRWHKRYEDFPGAVQEPVEHGENYPQQLRLL